MISTFVNLGSTLGNAYESLNLSGFFGGAQVEWDPELTTICRIPENGKDPRPEINLSYCPSPRDKSVPFTQYLGAYDHENLPNLIEVYNGKARYNQDESDRQAHELFFQGACSYERDGDLGEALVHFERSIERYNNKMPRRVGSQRYREIGEYGRVFEWVSYMYAQGHVQEAEYLLGRLSAVTIPLVKGTPVGPFPRNPRSCQQDSLEDFYADFINWDPVSLRPDQLDQGVRKSFVRRVVRQAIRSSKLHHDILFASAKAIISEGGIVEVGRAYLQSERGSMTPMGSCIGEAFFDGPHIFIRNIPDEGLFAKVLVHELTHFLMKLSFSNGAKPFGLSGNAKHEYESAVSEVYANFLNYNGFGYPAFWRVVSDFASLKMAYNTDAQLPEYIAFFAHSIRSDWENEDPGVRILLEPLMKYWQKHIQPELDQFIERNSKIEDRVCLKDQEVSVAEIFERAAKGEKMPGEANHLLENLVFYYKDAVDLLWLSLTLNLIHHVISFSKYQGRRLVAAGLMLASLVPLLKVLKES